MPVLQLDALNIHYEYQTNGDIPIVFLHGNFASWHYWQPCLQNLPDGYCGYAPDFRGCGDSDVTEDGYDIATLSKDILLFADALKINEFHLVGHSLGGAVAQQVAGTSPERILSLTLVAPAPAEGLAALDKTFSSNSFFSPQNVLHFLDRIGMKRKILSATFKKIMPGLKNHPKFLQQAIDDAIKMDGKAFSGFLETLKKWRGTHLLECFDFPVLIMHGDLDSVIPLFCLKNMQLKIKNCRFYTFRNIGHAPQLERPKIFNTLLSTFISGHDISDVAEPVMARPTSLLQQLKLQLKRIFK